MYWYNFYLVIDSNNKFKNFPNNNFSMTDISLYQHQSEIIEEKIGSAKQRAEESPDMELYSASVEDLYKLAGEKVPEVLPTLEKLVEETSINIFNTHLFLAIGKYIRYYIPPAEDNNTYKQMIQKLKKGLELLLEPNVYRKLSNLYWDVHSRELIPSDFDLYVQRIQLNAYFTHQRLDWKTIREYAQRDAAYDYLYSHIKCLLSNPDGYI